MSQRLLALVVLSLALLYRAAPASAETVVLLPPRGDDALATARRDAQQVLAQALAAQNVRTVTLAEATAHATDSTVADCTSLDCAPALLRAAGADAAAALAVWGAGQPATPNAVYVTLADRRGDRYPGKARVEDADLAAATKQALLDARALQLLGPGPWLRVHANPEGSQILLDGKLAGSAPYRAPITSGRHTLEVRFEGRRPHVQSVDVPPHAARQIEIDVDLAVQADVSAAAVAANAPTPEGHESRNTASIVGPLILGGVGLAIVAYDVIALASSGCERREPSGACTKKSQVNAAPAAIFGVVGVGAIAGAAVWYLLGQPDAPTEPLAFSAGPGAIELRGTF
ncbi:MAG: PEGA domain-containing protein [Polyangiales bacterium]